MLVKKDPFAQLQISLSQLEFSLLKPEFSLSKLEFSLSKLEFSLSNLEFSLSNLEFSCHLEMQGVIMVALDRDSKWLKMQDVCNARLRCTMIY